MADKSCRIGIDIGSTCAKVVALDEQDRIAFKAVEPTGWSSVDAAERLKKLLESNEIDVESSRVVATGYGRNAVTFADKRVTEISCHARGASWLHDSPELLVIDIGGQDTKVIHVENGKASEFLMNDKCAAGTGRFLEIMANTMGLKPNELDDLARNGGGTTISSLCTVFAESEVIGLIGRGEARENIGYAIIDSIAGKVASQAQHLISAGERVCLTGGLCESNYLREALSKKLKRSIETVKDGRYAGAVGAALLA